MSEKKVVQCSAVLPTSLGDMYKKSAKRSLATRIKVVSPEFLPVYKTAGAACCDLLANIDQDLVIHPLDTVKVDCGFKIEVPIGYEAQIRSRSGLASKGLIVSNGIGTIDADFRGNVQVLLTNINKDSAFIIKRLDRIAQMALKPVYWFHFVHADELDQTERGEGGFGSTGVK